MITAIENAILTALTNESLDSTSPLHNVVIEATGKTEFPTIEASSDGTIWINLAEIIPSDPQGMGNFYQDDLYDFDINIFSKTLKSDSSSEGSAYNLITAIRKVVSGIVPTDGVRQTFLTKCEFIKVLNDIWKHRMTFSTTGRTVIEYEEENYEL